MLRFPILALLLVPALLAQARQTPTDPTSVVPMRPGFEYLRPFRAPNKNLQPPLEFYDELRKLDAIARNPNGARVWFDDDGREACDHPAWKEGRTRALIKGTQMGGYLAVVGQESESVGDRRLAHYGSYFVDSVQDTIAIMSLIPGEPVATIREEAMPRALAFLRVHLVKNRGGEGGVRDATPTDHAEGRAVGNKVYENPDEPIYDFDVRPWCALVEAGDTSARAQALWFLREVIGFRKEVGPVTLALTQTFLGPLVMHENQELRKQARAYVHVVDPERRALPKEDAAAEDVQRWLAQVIYTVFPPIRRVSSGLYDLHQSADLDRIAATGADLLARDALGSVASGTVGGVYYRGYRLQRIPKPLDQLGIPVDAVITHVNGLPITDSKSLLDAVKLVLESRKALMVEFVADRQTKAIEYRVL